jgi:hypothetical protein
VFGKASIADRSRSGRKLFTNDVTPPRSMVIG